jgi:hypothetical protein
MQSIRPIETFYKGYRFRSRLEARWAVFLDAVGASWEYEPEGYQMPGNQRYLPDFLVHDVKGRSPKDLYIEVKGALTKMDLRKIETFAGQYCPRTPTFSCHDCPAAGRCGYQNSEKNPILIVGAIPDPENYWNFMTGYWYNHQNEPFSEHYFNLYLMDGDWFPAIPCMNINGGLHIDDGNYNYIGGVDEGLTKEAYRLARSARFD